MQMTGRWITSLSFIFWLFATYWVFGQRGESFPPFLGIDRMVLAVAALASLALCVLTCWILIVRKAWTAKASRRRVAAVAIVAGVGGSVALFLGVGTLVLEIGGPCG